MIFLMRKTLETPSSSKNWIRGLIIFIWITLEKKKPGCGQVREWATHSRN
jgi:hypothetical protein